MKTIKEISDDVLGTVQDDGYNEDSIISFVNSAMTEIAGKVLLPELQTQGTVLTVVSQNYAALSATFHRNLFYCYSETNLREIDIYKDFRKILKQVGVIDQAGYIYGVAIRGSNLHYQGIPATPETLQIHFYRKPTVILSREETPLELPESLAESLLFNYCCKRIYSKIEDGIDGKMANTIKYSGWYAQALLDLAEFLGPEASAPIDIPQDIHWDSM